MADYDVIARPYAQAVFELARDSGSLDAWSRVLDAAAAVIREAETAGLLDTPGLDTERFTGMILEICSRASDASPREQLESFLRLLAENRRLALLPGIAERFEKLKAEVQNTLDVVLTSSSPVDEEQRAKMVAALRERFGREINLRFELDESLIGGARLKAEDLVIDGSVRTGLEKLASALVH